ncbi:bifunctional aspartate kinase/homoserine dehydrogenase I [Lysobacter solisilvae (ex Woo and Kim 2020)]|uniref:Bifunctional aspartokinase/homoserine dehydrogenase n=1 Tax=Agrilutibacter terrestris TaxID=2865112 RepID=A0A7H0FZS8_9GAMM|nr:bifunctional aspartate kinase/homoserine dehydrogenase I [Lysobacter terrestris]QNP41544.1 bifunctional aspartate kinase/homoserine dehydrogenase I [Lysobacter terrestris]
MSVSPPPAPLQSRAAASSVVACHAHKFGGSSLATAERFRHVAALLRAPGASRVVVVSAMHGVTDALTALADAALGKQPWEDDFRSLRARHLDTARDLDDDGRQGLHAWLEAEFAALHAQLSAPSRKPEWHATVQGLGEVWSTRLLHAALGEAAPAWAVLDAREVLQVHAGELGVGVDWAGSRTRLAAWRSAHAQANAIVTGFIARASDGAATTLGRNGSDYSAAIFAVLFDAGELTIWTDVDGVLSADPRLVPDAVCLESMSYAEACELAYFGAKVLHPQTMAPAMQAGLPIRIRNTLDPDAPGTLITAQSAPAASPVKGLSLVSDMAMLELTGAGLIGVPGTAERMFAALHTACVSVTMISQGSSEHSICCVLRADQAERGRMAVQAAFRDAIADGQVEGVRITPGVSVLAAVGDGMVGTPGVSARLFNGLAQARVNIRAIAQGASERNISVAIAAEDATRGLRAAHSAFWLSPQTLSVGIIGPGNVGRALLAQLAQAASRYGGIGTTLAVAGGGLDLRLRAIANSRSMHLAPRKLDPAEAVEALELGQPLDYARFAAHVRAEHLPHAMIVDCSGSNDVAEHYADWLAAGIHVVTPNKQAGAGPLARYRAIRAATRHGGHFRYEATVGAGLPVIQTLRNQLDTGDELTEVEGVFSGTLAWLFNRFDGSVPFSQLVNEAREAGYTEPDPRDDLGGVDVARKLVILAREAGRELSLADVEIESLVPPALREVTREEFLSRLHELDAPLQARLDAARAQGRALRYLARLDRDGRASVGLVSPAPDHASLHGRLTDNLIQFRTRRYASNPLVVQGPGAGPEVTAAGVFGDILAIAQALGARP